MYSSFFKLILKYDKIEKCKLLSDTILVYKLKKSLSNL